VTRHHCYRFTGSRHRDAAVDLSPPFAEPDLLAGVGYLPLLLENMVVISFLNGGLAAYEKGTRAVRWRLQLKARYEASLPFYGFPLFNGKQLLVSDGGDLVVLDPKSGELQAREKIDEINLRTGAPLPDGFIATYKMGKAYHLGRFRSPEWGQPVWTRPVPLAVEAIAATRQVCCCHGQLGEVVSVDPESGSERWRVSVREQGSFVDDLGRPRKGEIAGDLILWNDVVITGVRGNRVIALEARTGHLRWSVAVDSLTPSNLTLDASGVLHLLAPSRYYQIDARDGKIIAEVGVESALEQHKLFMIGHLDVSATHVFAADLNGTLFALERASGRVSWKFDLGAQVPFSNHPLLADDRVYHLDGAGVLRTF